LNGFKFYFLDNLIFLCRAKKKKNKEKGDIQTMTNARKGLCPVMECRNSGAKNEEESQKVR